jgi:outer membrane protein assembly factor BamB
LSNAEGTYIHTPLFYDGILYTCGNNGVVTAYDGASGERIYRARVGGGGSFSASPVAADGRLYFSNEDGDIFVVKAGRATELAKKDEGGHHGDAGDCGGADRPNSGTCSIGEKQ